MSDKKNDNRNQTTDNESRDQKTVGSNNNKPTTINPDKQERVPNEKVPNIGDPKRKTSIEDNNTKKTNAIKDERSESRNEGRKETSEDKKKFNPNK